MVRRLVFLGLLVAGMLGIGGYVGWTQGYDAGLGAEGGVVGHAPYAFGFFKVLLLLFVLLIISKLLFFGAWRHRGGHGGRWGRNWGEWHERYHEELHEGKRPPRNAGEGDNPIVA